jgi:hypothetical protein
MFERAMLLQVSKTAEHSDEPWLSINAYFREHARKLSTGRRHSDARCFCRFFQAIALHNPLSHPYFGWREIENDL